MSAARAANLKNRGSTSQQRVEAPSQPSGMRASNQAQRRAMQRQFERSNRNLRRNAIRRARR